MTLQRVRVEVNAPAKSPCDYCPYRRDVPSGVWSASEYAKLPGYDRETFEQPPGVFMCHKKNSRVCAGWAGCHGRQVGRFDLVALRFAGMFGIAAEVVEAVMQYVSPVPLFGSGREAAEHGLRDINAVGEEAEEAMDRLEASRELRARRKGRAG